MKRIEDEMQELILIKYLEDQFQTLDHSFEDNLFVYLDMKEKLILEIKEINNARR